MYISYKQDLALNNLPEFIAIKLNQPTNQPWYHNNVQKNDYR